MPVENPDFLLSTNDAAEAVRQQALIAASQSCYGVGGIIVENKTGRVIRAWGNRAQGKLKSGEYYPLDPSNHGETQLVRWYFENQDELKNELGYIPRPQDLTVITSLDPCAMCAGGLCAAGFNVGVIAPDDSGGGVNWDSTAEFNNIPGPIQEDLRTLFGYYSVEDVAYRSSYEGNPGLLFNSGNLSRYLYQANTAAFDDSAALVKAVRGNSRIDLEAIQDPATLPSDDPTITLLRQHFPEALQLRLSDKLDVNLPGLPQSNLTYYKPTEELHRLLKQLVALEPGATNAVAMIDKFGNLLRIGVDTPSQGPIKTALFNAVSDYSRYLFGLISDASDESVPGKYKDSIAYNYLSPTNSASYIYLRAPSGGLAATLKDLGLFGSSSGGIIQYIETPSLGTKLDFEQHVRSLPIFYSINEEITPLQTVPDHLRIVVSNGNNAGQGSLRRAITTANKSDGYRLISINTDQPIALKSQLPIIRNPIDLSPDDSSSRPIIDFGGTNGFRLSPAATGSSLTGLRLKSASGFAINSKTTSLQLSRLRFGGHTNTSLNILGSIRNPSRFHGINLQGWDSAAANVSQDYNISTRSIDIKTSYSSVSTLRVDSEKELVHFGFYNRLQPSSIETLSTYDPARSGALTAAAIETGLDNANSLSHLTGEPFGLQTVQRLEQGQWLPVATLDDPQKTPLNLTRLTQSGNTIEGEFKLLMSTAKKSGNPALLDLIDKTFKFSWTLPVVSTNSRAQKGELAVRYLRQDDNQLRFGFYEVSDPLTGLVNGLLPHQNGYAKAAISKSIEDGLFLSHKLSNNSLPDTSSKSISKAFPSLGSSSDVAMKMMDPRKSYGLVVAGFSGGHEREDRFYTSYNIPNENQIYPFQGFLLSNGLVAVGVESDHSVHRGDFSDLVLTLPDNVSLLG